MSGHFRSGVSNDVTKVLDPVADVVLAYRPKPKSRAGKARKRRAAKIERKNDAARD